MERPPLRKLLLSGVESLAFTAHISYEGVGVGGYMYYVISFDGCGLESPLRSRSVQSAIALAEEAERNGCENVIVTAPGGEVLPFRQFALQYGGGGPRPREA